MTTLKVALGGSGPRPVVDPPNTKGKGNRSRMVIYAIGDKKRLTIPYAPRSVTYSNFGGIWEEVQRDGNRIPLLLKRGKGLKKMSFELFIGHEDWERPVMETLDHLRRIAKTSQYVMVNWSSWEKGAWRITNMVVVSEHRAPITNEITRANVQVELTRVSDSKKKRGPASGGKNDGDRKDIPKKYKVKQGDTLMKIGMKFYKDHKAWKRIATKNKMKNPRKDHKLKPGRILRLP